MYEFKVEGMTCDHCLRTVEKAVLSVTGNVKPTVDLQSKTVRVDWNESEKIGQAIEDSGYSVLSVRET